MNGCVGEENDRNLPEQEVNVENNTAEEPKAIEAGKVEVINKITEKPARLEEVKGLSEKPVKLEEANGIAEKPVKLEEANGIEKKPVKLEEANGIAEKPVKLEESNGIAENPVKVEETNGAPEELGGVVKVQEEVVEVQRTTKEPDKVDEVFGIAENPVKVEEANGVPEEPGEVNKVPEVERTTNEPDNVDEIFGKVEKPVKLEVNGVTEEPEEVNKVADKVERITEKIDRVTEKLETAEEFKLKEEDSTVESEEEGRMVASEVAYPTTEQKVTRMIEPEIKTQMKKPEKEPPMLEPKVEIPMVEPEIETPTTESNVETPTVEPEVTDDEDDYEGYFLEPVGGSINIAEKIAEANKKLFEEEEDDENRPRKVQFSEEVINFEPVDYSDEECTESARNSIISEEEAELKLNEEEGEIEEESIGKTEISYEQNLNETEEDPPTTRIDEDDEPEAIPEEASDDQLKDNLESEKKVEIENAEKVDFMDDAEEISEELDIDTVPTEIEEEEVNDGRSKKLLFVLMPKEQNSSCESIIGEEILEEEGLKVEEKEPEPEKPIRAKIIRPKSAYNKNKKSCEMSKISPDLNCSSSPERKSWQGTKSPLTRSKKLEINDKNVFNGEIRVKITGKLLKKINIENLNLRTNEDLTLKRCSENRPKSSYNDWKGFGRSVTRPKTAPMKRNCCVIKTELPQYNGLRSEYGLTAEQLQERKQRTLEIKHQKIQNKIKERQEELKKRNENEEAFQKWLFNKRKKSVNKKPIKIIDVLARSDMYIQTHASYAMNRSVPYSVDYSLDKKMSKKREGNRPKQSKTLNVAKLLEKVSPHFKRSFNIYLGVRPSGA